MGKASNRKWTKRYQWPIARLMKLRKAQWLLRRFGNEMPREINKGKE